MARRIEVDRGLPPAVIAGRVLSEMAAHAREAYPEECCGLLIGDRSVRHRRAVRCRNEMTRMNQLDPVSHPRDGRQGFFMHPLDYHKAQEQAEERGERVTAVYHSHVGYGPYLSELDQEYATQPMFPFPGADHIVLSLHERRVGAIGLFRRDGPGGEFSGRLVHPDPPGESAGPEVPDGS